MKKSEIINKKWSKCMMKSKQEKKIK